MRDGSFSILASQKEYLMVSGVCLYIRHFVALMLGLGFGQSSQCPGRLHHIKCSKMSGTRFLLLFGPGAALFEGREVAESFFTFHSLLASPALSQVLSPLFLRRVGRLTSLLRFASWIFFFFLHFSFLSLPLSMTLVFGKQVQISLVYFFNVTVIIAYTANFTKSNIIEVIY